MRPLFRVFLALLLIAVFSTCDEFPEDPTGTGTGLLSVTISAVDWPAVAAIAGEAELNVEVADNQGRVIVDPPVRWEALDPQLADVDPTAEATTAILHATGLGWARVRVFIDDERYRAGDLTDSVRIALAGVRITSPSGDTTLTAFGDGFTIHAAGLDADGGTVATNEVNWNRTGQSALNLVSQAGSQVGVEAVAEGVDTVWAQVSGACPGGVCEAFLVVEVAQAAASVEVSPATATIERGETVQLSAQARDGGDNPMSTSFEWSSSDGAVATVDETGLVTGVGQGEVNITATAAGTAVGGTAAVTVVQQAGSIQGRVYRDENGNGLFDTGEEGLANATVTLVQGTPPAGDTVATTTTDPDGVYAFGGVVEGDYVVAVEPMPGTTIDPASQPATVTPDQTTTVDFTFTGAVVGPISGVRAAGTGDPVAAEAVAISATTGDGTLSADVFYLQDGTGGVAVQLPGDAFPTGVDVSIADSLRVVGTRGEAPAGYVWIEAESVELLGVSVEPDPVRLFASDIGDGLHQGELAVVWDLVVDSIRGAADEYVWGHDPADGDTPLLINVQAATGIDPLSTFGVGQAFTVTAVVTRTNPFALEPRQPADIETGFLPPVSIADARAAALDDYVSVVGVVTAGTSVFTTAEATFYLQDGTGGILAFMPADSFPDGRRVLEEGDSVWVQGQRGVFNDEAQIVAHRIRGLGTGTVPDPRLVTPAEINGDLFQGELAEVADVLVDSITGAGSELAWVSDDTPEALAIFVDPDIGLTALDLFVVSERYAVRGIIGRNVDRWHLQPRSASDVGGLAQTLPIGDARVASAGTEVAVTGVVTIASGTLVHYNAVFIQDGTGGIMARFPASDFPTPPELSVGDSVTVAGLRTDLEGGLVALDAYELALQAGGASVDTATVSVFDMQVGDFQGRLVRLEDITVFRVIELSRFLIEDPGRVVGMVDLGPTGIGTAAIADAVGGVYDAVGVVGIDTIGPVLWPRASADISTLVPPGDLWVRFVNVPSSADSVRLHYVADIAGTHTVLDPRPLEYASIPVGDPSLEWWFDGWRLDVLEHASDVHFRTLDGSIDVTLVACLVPTCASGSGEPIGPLGRTQQQAPYEMFGIHPTAEASGANDILEDAQPLHTLFLDFVEGVEVFAHAGHLEAGVDESDVYAFQAFAGDRMTIETLARRVDADGNLDTYIYLYDGAGNALGANDDYSAAGTLDSRIVYDVQADGTYYVRVSRYMGDTNSGVYTLSVILDF